MKKLFVFNRKNTEKKDVAKIKRGTFRFLEDIGEFGTLIINPKDYKKIRESIPCLKELNDIEEMEYIYIRPKNFDAFCIMLDTVISVYKSKA